MTGDTEAQIAAAIDAAEEIRNPLDELVERAATDPGAPFEPDALQLLRETHRHDPAAYERTILRLRTDSDVRIGPLERLIKVQTGSTDAEATSGALEWPEDERWQHRVDGKILLDEAVGLIERHVVLPQHSSQAIVLWIAFSHSLDLWQFSPRLAFVSPEKRCGKTTALAIVQRLVPRPLPAANITSAAVFRTIESACPTLLIDEADTFLTGNDELRGVLNSGHNRATAFVVRTVGEDHQPAKFGTWAPVAIAMIGKLPDTLHDRSIVVPLRRKKPGEIVERCRFDRSEEFDALRRKLRRWVEDARRGLLQWDGDVPASLHDRAADNWWALLAVADAAGGHWPQTARQAAVALSSGGEDAESAAVLLLHDMYVLFAQQGARIPTQTVLAALHAMDERP
jgi:putative DNA primase/helicase